MVHPKITTTNTTRYQMEPQNFTIKFKQLSENASSKTNRDRSSNGMKEGRFSHSNKDI